MAEETKPEEKQESPKMNENKLWGILSYISLLCLIPLFTKKDNDFVYFHAKQGLVLFITEIIWYVITSIVSALFLQNIVVLSIWGVIATLVELGLVILVILGIVNVVQNKKKELPLIGKFSEKIKI
ncbi:MAG TPA: DUF4870 domain-containing protein [Candidatus Paceibacterota bacterium]|nr:DUF4870 domain-containing protein [Candidatus Paceibacterota bacterium]